MKWPKWFAAKQSTNPIRKRCLVEIEIKWNSTTAENNWQRWCRNWRQTKWFLLKYLSFHRDKVQDFANNFDWNSIFRTLSVLVDASRLKLNRKMNKFDRFNCIFLLFWIYLLVKSQSKTYFLFILSNWRTTFCVNFYNETMEQLP